MNLSKPTIISINISKGGVPKLPIEEVYIRNSGLDGDGHNHEKHNRSGQAVCIQDIEMLNKLSTMGYPLIAGTAGENLTVESLYVNDLPVGTQLKFSGGVQLEITRVRPTCYVMDQINPRLKDDAKGCHGMYAKVIKEGFLRTGETIEVIKAGAMGEAPPLYGLLLCGGQSSRMGVEKAIINYHGTSQIEYYCSLLSKYGERVYISCRPEQDSVLGIKAYPRIFDEPVYAEKGPISGILTAMKSHPKAAWFILACDMPLVSEETILRLVNKRASHKCATVYVNPQSGIEPLCAIYEPQIFKDLEKAMKEGLYSPQTILTQCEVETIKMQDQSELINVNTPAEAQSVIWHE